MKASFRLHVLFIAMGFAAMAAQILIMRRLIVCFGGNELISGGVLAGWLGFSGLGNLIAGKFADRLRDAWRSTALWLIAMALLMPATIVATYFVKPALGLAAPAMVGLETALISAIVISAPLGLAIGVSFTLACKLPATNQASDIARAYLFDAIGSGIGGLIVSLFVLQHTTALQSSFAASAMLAACVAATIPRRVFRFASIAVLAALIPAMWQAYALDARLTSAQWRGYNPAVHRDSLIATLMVTDNRGERTLFSDNRPLFSLPLPETYESISLLPLLEHPAPKHVLMIEGGISGVLDRWRGLGLDRAYFSRLDPDVTLLERTEMPSHLDDLPAWVEIHHTDGRKFVREGVPGRCATACFDVVIVNVSEPDTAAADRYYTKEFFEEAAQALKPGGVLCLALMDTSNSMSKERVRLLGGIEATLGSVFPHVMLLPLDRYYYLASAESGALTADPSELARRLDERHIRADFLRSVVLAGIYPERIESAQKEIASAAAGASIDTDLKPRAYFNGLLLWERRAGEGMPLLARAGELLNPWKAAALIILMMALSAIAGRSRAIKVRIAATWALFSTGFASIVYEVVLLVHYQMSVGILVWRLGFIITAFMVGAGAGAWTAVALDRYTKGRWTLIAPLAICAVYTLLLFIVADVSAIAANLGMGLIAGFIYQRTAKSLAAEGLGIGTVAGIVQNADLWGAAVGAMIASAIAIPLLGLWASLVMAALALACAIAVILILQ